MRERGILFSGPMVRKILARVKTQTRRPVKPLVTRESTIYAGTVDYWRKAPVAHVWSSITPEERAKHYAEIRQYRVCPYDVPRLWVRESFALRPDGKPIFMADASHGRAQSVVWRPSIFMPRTVCRATLGVDKVRVERAQEISEYDIAAEGVDPNSVDSLWAEATGKRRREAYDGGPNTPPWLSMGPRELWRIGWTLINGRASWDANPWVWVVEFRRLP